jgi:outer membrane murein-binding lipoprotein Lpp
MYRARLPSSLTLLLGALIYAPVALAAPKSYGVKLVKLRSEVSALSAQLARLRAGEQAEQRALQARKKELALLLDAERLRIKGLEARLAKVKAKKTSGADKRAALSEAVLSGAASLRAAVKRSLPYRRKQRLAALDKLTGKLKAGRVDGETAALALWRLTEDEIRLTMLIEGGERAVRIAGAERLVPVVRLGMLTLYTDLGKGRYGRLLRGSDGRWRHERVTGKRARKQLRALLHALHRQVREGAYSLPIPVDALRRGGQGS